MMNHVQLLGRVKRIVIRQTNAGHPVAQFSMVTSEKYMQDNQKIEKTQWHYITCFGRTADIVQKYVQDGDLLLVLGKIDYQKYTAKDGQERTKTTIVCNELKLLPQGRGKKEEDKSEQESTSFDDDQIPF